MSGDADELDERILAAFALPPPQLTPAADPRVAELRRRISLGFYHYFGRLDEDAVRAEIESWS